MVSEVFTQDDCTRANFSNSTLCYDVIKEGSLDFTCSCARTYHMSCMRVFQDLPSSSVAVSVSNVHVMKEITVINVNQVLCRECRKPKILQVE